MVPEEEETPQLLPLVLKLNECELHMLRRSRPLLWTASNDLAVVMAYQVSCLFLYNATKSFQSS